MDGNLFYLIELAQNGDECALFDIIDMFSPKINKYVRIYGDDEDLRSELTLHIIEIIRNLKLEKFLIKEHPIAVSYFNKAIDRRVWKYAKQKGIARKEVTLYDNADLDYLVGKDAEASSAFDDVLLDSLMRDKLTEKEYRCLHLLLFDGLSQADIARLLGVSRQSVSETIIRALGKLGK